MEFWPEFLAGSWGREFVAGGLGGMAGVVAGHPLDTLRIRLQQPRHAFSTIPSSATGLVRHILKNEGASAFFKGMSSPLATVAFQNAFAFQTYALLGKALSNGDSSSHKMPLEYSRVAVAGFVTGGLQTLILCPVDLVKIRLQLQLTRKGEQARGVGPLALAMGIFRKEGIRGLYKGYGVTFLRDAPAHAVYFTAYEAGREALQPGCRKNGGESFFTMVTAGGFAGAMSWVGCYPLDVLKTRVQTQGSRYKGMVDCWKVSVKEEGLRVMWRGLGTALARAYIVNGAIFTAYEMTLRFLAGSSEAVAEEESSSSNASTSGSGSGSILMKPEDTEAAFLKKEVPFP